MPKIPQDVLQTAFYLYPDSESARKGEGFGGTGFAVHVPSAVPGGGYIYAVTNWHVAVKDGCSTIRLNVVDGSVEIIELDPSDWHFIPKGPDIAVVPLRPDLQRHALKAIPIESFATREVLEKASIGCGDDTFMVGRFIDHDGGPRNRPALRFGNISAMPQPIDQPTNYRGDAYCIDQHSRSGFSGSAVFVYRTPGQDLTINGIAVGPVSNFLFLLGIHMGQFPEPWELRDWPREESVATLDPARKQIIGLSGMTIVVPAWEIERVLNEESLVARRKRGDELARSRGLIPGADVARRDP